MNFRGLYLRQLGLTKDPGGSLIKVIAVESLSRIGITTNSKTYESIRKLFHLVSRPSVNTQSFSIFGEDKVLRNYLPESNGRYLDIGAGDPKYGSNTYFLYERGWSGVSIEPLNRNFRKHRSKRKRDRQIQACMVSHPLQESVRFYEFIADEFSTDSPERVKKLELSGIYFDNSYDVPALRIGQLGLTANPLDAFLLDLDIEGNEFEVLSSNDWSTFKPRVISVEEWESPINLKSAIRKLLESHNYILVSRCFITSIYVHSLYLNMSAKADSARSDWFAS